MKKLFSKIVDVKPNEIHALLLAFVFNFVVLGGYYVIRPIRDEIGADRGVENLPWMYTGTLIGMRQRYRSLLRDEVAHTVDNPADVPDEIRYLCAALAAGTE